MIQCWYWMPTEPLAAEDASILLWERIAQLQESQSKEFPFKKIFSSSTNYTYTACRQAVLPYEEAAARHDFDAICMHVARSVTVHPEFIAMLRMISEDRTVRAVVMTCGLRQVWELILHREGLAQVVKVIGCGRLADGFVVTPNVKAGLVKCLRYSHHQSVWVFGDSVPDLEMLRGVTEAIVVVGSEQSRSKFMDRDLALAIEDRAFEWRQALIPSTTRPRLEVDKLPIADLTSHHFIHSVFRDLHKPEAFNVVHATKKHAAKLLMTATRDARIVGPALREAHRQTGWYLAVEFLGDIIGVEDFPIPHVQGHEPTGHRLFHEQQTLIVAVMRGGEPMAFGVSQVLASASFMHAFSPQSIDVLDLSGKLTVVLVDSVVNNGDTMMKFVEHICQLHASIHIVLVAGVVQAEAIAKMNAKLDFVQTHGRKLDLIALRLSENKCTGKGATDTGDRLFSTIDHD